MSASIITRVNGPVVEVETEAGLAMRELVAVGPQRLPGEVIALEGPGATVQVYEYTGGLRPGDEVIATGGPW
jgi:V/A-type H+/Na+-transporting ATPase subunit A